MHLSHAQRSGLSLTARWAIASGKRKAVLSGPHLQKQLTAVQHPGSVSIAPEAIH